MKTDWTPKNLTIVGSGVVAALLILPNLGKGWEAVKYLADAPPTAYAAKGQAEAVQSDFSAYLEAQEQQRKLDAKLAEQQALYNQRLLELQESQQVYQQQQPLNVSAPLLRFPEPEVIEWEDPDGTWWCCDPRTDCDLMESWWRCD